MLFNLPYIIVLEIKMTDKKIIIAVTGASGVIYTKLLFKKLLEIKFPIKNIAVIFSDNAREVWKYELPKDKIENLPFKIFRPDDFYASPASGSAGFDAMIICPCTMGTLGKIASGMATDLITRAADVMLKERKTLILVTREMPLNLIHINNMKTITEAGGIICPASPSFYSLPKNAEESYTTVINKILSLTGIHKENFIWGETN